MIDGDSPSPPAPEFLRYPFAPIPARMPIVMLRTMLPARRARLDRVLAERDLPALLVTSPLNVSWLTGFTGDSSFAVVLPGRVCLVSDTRFAIQIAEECPDLETRIRGPHTSTWQEAGDLVRALGLTSLAIEADEITLAQEARLRELCGNVRLIPTGAVVERLRAVKDEYEVGEIRRAVQIAHRAFDMFRAMISADDSEKSLADAMEGYVRRAGGIRTGFPTIVGIGDRSALPHCPPSARKVGESPFLLLDWGAVAGQYTSDVTRVMPSPGRERNRQTIEIETRLRKIYTVVLQAQGAAEAGLRPGVDVRSVDRLARRVVEDAGFGERFNHGLGHGIGLEVHEMPSVRTNSDDVLEAGQVITLEPGIYLDGFGGVRIEDDFLITADGCERLTRAIPREWEELWQD